MDNNTIKYYNDNSEKFINSTLNVNMSELYTLFQKHVKSGCTILDFGCGSGRDSKYFIEQGYHVIAIDGSKELCKKASQYIGQPVEEILFNQLSYTNKFDGIWACSSMLHVDIEELPDIFKRLYEALKPSGIIHTSFKYGNFSGNRSGRYFCDFTEDSIRKLLVNVYGLNIIEILISDDVRQGHEDEKWLNVIIKKIR
ncbi:MAG: class I SAM-dependent methyltransferase [Clostridiales bacterium]